MSGESELAEVLAEMRALRKAVTDLRGEVETQRGALVVLEGDFSGRFDDVDAGLETIAGALLTDNGEGAD
ncbi:hypothetical protein [Georgenia wangjunii]|uniref:hypothetical protein n=1 Tax=Georgenia wangjunii TaxID=3117730 RepID=UPI002F2625B1